MQKRQWNVINTVLNDTGIFTLCFGCNYADVELFKRVQEDRRRPDWRRVRLHLSPGLCVQQKPGVGSWRFPLWQVHFHPSLLFRRHHLFQIVKFLSCASDWRVWLPVTTRGMMKVTTHPSFSSSSPATSRARWLFSVSHSVWERCILSFSSCIVFSISSGSEE